MKKISKESFVIFLQFWLFYISPLFANSTDLIGMVMFITSGTFILSVVMGCISNKRLKYLYPPVVLLLFFPTIFIYYNESAFIFLLWFFVASSIGVIIGTLLYRGLNQRKKSNIRQ